jgi:pimeloyl-ACP methyl ester carboxylesterase
VHTHQRALRGVSILLGALVLLAGGSALAQMPAKHRVDPLVAALGKGFGSAIAKLNGATLHHVRGGTGPPVILVHGFPQDWYAYHRIMPRLAKSFTVVAADMRGVGRSTAPPSGFDATDLAHDIRQLADRLKLGRVYVAGHDNGGMIAYTYARLYPGETRGVMILDSPLPGIEPWAEVKANASLWHFGFHQTPKLPEILLAGRQFAYFREFFDRLALNGKAIADADVRHYASAYARPEQLRAGLEFYRRAYPASEKFNAAERSAIAVPIVLAGGDHAMGNLNERLAESLRQHGWANVTVEVIRNSGHWVVDEQPDIVAALIERHATQ